MIQKITVNPDTVESQILFFKELDFTQIKNTNNLILLFGPNGVGKTTLFQAIFNAADNSALRHSNQGVSVTSTPCKIYGYSNSSDNLKVRKPQSYLESFDLDFIADQWSARQLSEGQSILFSALSLVDALKPGKHCLASEGVDTVILLDEIDSGLSVDNIDIIMRKIKYALARRNDLQVILSFNSPRVLKHCQTVISMYDGSLLHMETDEDMLAEINKHKSEFDAVRKTAKGWPKVYD